MVLDAVRADRDRLWAERDEARTEVEAQRLHNEMLMWALERIRDIGGSMPDSRVQDIACEALHQSAPKIIAKGEVEISPETRERMVELGMNVNEVLDALNAPTIRFRSGGRG